MKYAFGLSEMTAITKDLLENGHEIFVYDKNTGNVYKTVSDEDAVSYTPNIEERVMQLIHDRTTPIDEKSMYRTIINSKYGRLGVNDLYATLEPTPLEDIKL